MQIISWGIKIEYTAKKPNVKDTNEPRQRHAHPLIEVTISVFIFGSRDNKPSEELFYMRVNKNGEFSLKKVMWQQLKTQKKGCLP